MVNTKNNRYPTLFHGYLSLTRPLDSIVIGLGLTISIIVAGGLQKGLPFHLYLILFFAGYFVTAHTMVINDIQDFEIDLINAPDRVLPSGIINKSQAFIFALVLLFIGVGLFGLIDLLGLSLFRVNWLWGLSHVMLANVYSLWVKKSGFVGNLIVAYASWAIFLYADIFYNGYFTTIPLIFGAMAFFISLSREVLKGIIDVQGDSLHNVKTIAVVLGPQYAIYLALLFETSCIILAIVIFPEFLVVGKVGTLLLIGAVGYAMYFSVRAKNHIFVKKAKTLLLLIPAGYVPFILIDRVFDYLSS